MSTVRLIAIAMVIMSALVYVADYGYGNVNCGVIRVDTSLNIMELVVQSSGGGCAGLGVLGWALTPSRDGTWYVTAILRVEDNAFVFYGTLFRLEWKLRIF